METNSWLAKLSLIMVYDHRTVMQELAQFPQKLKRRRRRRRTRKRRRRRRRTRKRRRRRRRSYESGVNGRWREYFKDLL